MGKKHYTLLLVLIILVTLISIAPNSSATDADIIIEFEYDDFIYKFQSNDTRTLVLNGTVTCYMEGFGSNYQFLDVTVYVGDYLGWIQGGGPYQFKFTSNGTQNFSVEVLIPMDTENRTNNYVTADGKWEAKAHTSSIFTTTGNAQPDRVNITIYRSLFSNRQGAILMNPEAESRDWLDVYMPYLIGSVIIIVIIAVITVIYYFRRIR